MLRKKNFLVVTILILLVFLVTGCNLFPKPTKGIIKGRVVIPPSGKELSRDVSGWVPATNAVVTIVDANGIEHSVTTDANGYYIFENIAVKANTVVTAKVKVDGKTMVLKTVIGKAVKADGEYDSGKMTPESTALALVVEKLIKEGKAIDLEEIKKASSFDDLVEQVGTVLEEHGNVIEDDNVEGLIDEVKDEVANTTTALTSINISGQRIVGETLTASILPVGATVTYQWTISSTAAGTYTNITGATQSTYTLANTTAGKYIKVKATGTGNYTGTVTSAALGPILIPVTGVIIAGDAVVDKTLTANPIPENATVNYQWLRSDTETGAYANITGATGKTYKLSTTDKNKYIKVKVTGKDDYTGTETSDAVGPVVTAEVAEAKAAIKPSWEIKEIEGIYNYEGNLPKPNGVDDAEYRMTIKTTYADKSAAQASGRTVTTYFTAPTGVTVWYPYVYANNIHELVWRSTGGIAGEYALGMEGHPLCADDITVDGYIYVKLGSATETEFSVTVTLKDAVWEDVVYGTDTLIINRSEYEFVVSEEPCEVVSVDGLNSCTKITILDDDGELNAPGTTSLTALKTAVFGEAAEVDINNYKVDVSLNAKTPNGKIGHENRNVMINKLTVTDSSGADASSNLKVYLYANQDHAWFDLVQCVWGEMADGRGFNLSKDENTQLQAYAFATQPGIYTVKFEAIDIDNENAEICSGEAIITVTGE